MAEELRTMQEKMAKDKEQGEREIRYVFADFLIDDFSLFSGKTVVLMYLSHRSMCLVL